MDEDKFPEKKICEHYNDHGDDQCGVYLGECFHDDDDPLGIDRCHKLIPREEDELMPWMDPMICSDCNRPICNEFGDVCDVYIEYAHHNQYIRDYLAGLIVYMSLLPKFPMLEYNPFEEAYI